MVVANRPVEEGVTMCARAASRSSVGPTCMPPKEAGKRLVKARLMPFDWLDEVEWWPSRPWPSDHRDQFALSVAVAIDVPLGGLDRPVACQQLNIAERAACLMHNAGSAGDERSAA